MNGPIAGDVPDGFALRAMPDGIYLVDGRTIPVADDAALSVNHSEPVVSVEKTGNDGIGLGGAVIGVDVEQ